MKKLLLLLFSTSLINISFAQVGINTTNPRVTLDVTSMPSNLSALDGIMIPQLSGDQLLNKSYTKETTSALVYVTAAPTNPTGQVANIDKAGFYYFDGTLWQSLASDNGSGSSTISNRLSSNENTLTSTVNGATASSSIINSVSNRISGNSIYTSVNGLESSAVTLPSSNTLTSSTNTLTSTINGTAASANIINSVSNRISGNSIYTSVNGLESSAVTLPSSNTLTSSTNTLTSTINGTAASANIINSVSQAIDENTFALTTKVNGIASSSTTIPNIFTSNGVISQTSAGLRIVDLNGNYLMFTGSVQPRVKIGDATIPTATLDVGGTMRVKTLATGSTSDNIIVAGSDGILKQVSRSSFDTGTTTPTYSVTSNSTIQINESNTYQVIWCAASATTVNLGLPTSSMVSAGKQITIVCAAGTVTLTGTLPTVQNSSLVKYLSTGQRMTIIPVYFSGGYGWYVLDASYGGTTVKTGGVLVTNN